MNASLGGLDSEFQLFVLRAPYVDLLVERRKRGSSGVPYVKRELNWVRVAQRFPVRIEVENPDPDLFRMGASAVAIIDGPPR